MLRFRLVFLLPLLLALTTLHAATLVDPAPIAIPATLGDAQVSTAVRQALIGRRWDVTDAQPGLIKSTLLLRKHKANIEIQWSAGQLQIRYISSAKLNYGQSNGRRRIHANYLSWIDNLVADISRNLTLPIQ